MMYQEIERQVASRVGAGKERLSQDPPLSQNRNPDFEMPSDQMELSEWEQSYQPLENGVLNELKKLTERMSSKKDGLANLIGNASDME
jgi:hypothetical protein